VRIVWNSFHGRFSDNPRALWSHLRDRADLEHVWLAEAAHRHTFPAGTRCVDIDGPEAREVLESADYLIANTHTEVEWTKPAGTTYVQTWHGTPLKRVHRDVLWAPEGRLDRLDRDVARWDLLLSPNPESTPRLRQAFRYTGPVLESGYPRNDLLSSPEGEVVRERIRRDLGAAADTTVVLYAPTWRDQETLGGDSTELTFGLDAGRLAQMLGPDHLVLVRSHALVTGRTQVASAPGVRDVSLHPEVAELYCASDVLVTDYSSAMFDFAVTKRPLLFFIHDLARFRDETRGFYFDLFADPPGPTATTTEQLVEVLEDLPARTSEHAARYAEFRTAYAGLEDGQASLRVLERLGLTD
jgi:CDP-glycerol glycerophosphotransferase